jgi:predicted ArsR family transcriptional regulator
MPPKEKWNIKDAKALRAMAHPLRMRLMEVIAREGTATATQCAREVGESVANCSYHLNTLAKYGFVEEAERGQGREKPWRLVHKGHEWSPLRMDSDEGVLAAEAANEAFVEAEFALIRERRRLQSLEPDEWREPLGGLTTTVLLTAAETAELTAQMRKLLEDFRDRRDNPQLRPADARPVRFLIYTSVAPQR